MAPGGKTVVNRNLLIADGDAQLGQLYGAFLAREGYAVEVAAGGVDCLAALRRSRPAVLVLELELPWGGAAGVLSCLREEGPPFPGVVLTTCGLDEAALHEQLAAPVVAALHKPFPLAALRQAVQFAASPPARACADGAALPGELAGQPQTPAEPRPAGGPRAARAGVLVVDDEAGVREMLRLALEYQGFDVWLAASGREAVELYRRHRDRIAAALLDVRMPGLSGTETVAALRQIDPRLPCSFMTGDPGSDQTRDSLARSGAPVLAKPFRLEKLAQVLRHVAS
jgi:CheY-like chemotaxis protein